jgi:hypothetical protein
LGRRLVISALKSDPVEAVVDVWSKDSDIGETDPLGHLRTYRDGKSFGGLDRRQYDRQKTQAVLDQKMSTVLNNLRALRIPFFVLLSWDFGCKTSDLMQVVTSLLF